MRIQVTFSCLALGLLATQANAPSRAQGFLDKLKQCGAVADPASGKVHCDHCRHPTVVITTRGGIVTSNDCNSQAQQQLLVTIDAAAPGQGTSTDTGYSDPYGCTKAEWTKDEVVRRRREIMECQADAITERAAARQQAKATEPLSPRAIAALKSCQDPWFQARQ